MFLQPSPISLWAIYLFLTLLVRLHIFVFVDWYCSCYPLIYHLVFRSLVKKLPNPWCPKHLQVSIRIHNAFLFSVLPTFTLFFISKSTPILIILSWTMLICCLSLRHSANQWFSLIDLHLAIVQLVYLHFKLCLTYYMFCHDFSLYLAIYSHSFV